MQPSPAEMAYMIFKHTIPRESIQFECSSHMLMVLVHLDGRSNLTAVSKKAGLSIKEAVNSVTRLLAINIIETTPNGGAYLNKDFVNDLTKLLSVAVGPIAEILIEDAVTDFGHSIDTFPVFKAADLIEVLAKDIKREDKRISFKQQMVARIKQG
jgi:hypothetical protein